MSAKRFPCQLMEATSFFGCQVLKRRAHNLDFVPSLKAEVEESKNNLTSLRPAGQNEAFLLQFMNQTRGYPRGPLGQFLWLGAFAAWPHTQRVFAGSALVKVLLKNSPRHLHILLLQCVCGRDGTNWSGTSWYWNAFCGPVHSRTIFNVPLYSRLSSGLTVIKQTDYVFLYLITYVPPLTKVLLQMDPTAS